MILAALVALGVDKNELIEKLKLLDISNFEIEFKTVDRSGINALHARVKIADEKAHRHLSTIEKIINNSSLSDAVKNMATKIFNCLAEAEATVHGIEKEKVHFHEVGAMDAIVDVVGACIGFEMLGIEKFACSKIHVGSGFVEMQHGKFPVPPPAVTELLKNIPIYSTEIEGELITPTGAAIISTVCGSFGKIPTLKIEKTAYGAGTREYNNFPNVLRLFLGETEDASDNDFPFNENTVELEKIYETKNLILLETNLDDVSPQISGFVMERAFEIGALDCWFTAVQMKKNRPATIFSILCEKEKREVLTELLFTETTTLGVRVQVVERNSMTREIVKVKTKFGEIDVKIAQYKGKIVNAMPEFEMMKQAAKNFGVSLKTVIRAVNAEIAASVWKH